MNQIQSVKGFKSRVKVFLKKYKTLPMGSSLSPCPRAQVHSL